MTSTTAKDAIGAALVYLSDLDGDYASDHNGHGFNSRDTQFGNSLAKQYQQRGALTPVQLRAGLKMLQTYRNTQLQHIELPTFSALEAELLAAAPGIPAAPGAPRTIPFGSITADQIGGEISIHTAGNTRQVYLTFDAYHADLVNRAKDIPTRRYKDGVNIFDAAMLDKVIDAFPAYRQHESVTKELQRRAHAAAAAAAVAASEAAERAAAEKRMATLLANVGDLNAPLPGGKTLRQHQRDGVLWGLRANSGIIADEMGLGKTLEALVIAKAHRIPVFVIAPKSLKDNWLREAAEAGVPVAVHSWAKIPQVPLCDFVLIADEAHYAGNIAAKRTQAFLQLARAARAVLCLTGTPVRNGRPREIFPLLKVIGHPLAADQKAFEKRYCAAQKTRFTQWDTTGAAFMAELYEKIAPWLLRRRKEDCLDLPAKSRILRPADVSAAGEKAYNALFEQKRAEYEARLETKYQRRAELVRRCTELIDLMKTAVDMDAMDEMDEEYSAAQTEIRKIDNAQNAEALVMLSILRQAGAAAKAECAIDTAREIIEQGDQVVLFCESRDVARQIGAALSAEVLDGEAKDRQGMVDRFQRGERKAIVCTFKAGGVGITLTAGSYNILVDRPWTPGDAEQAEDRIYRIGQTKPTTMLWLQYGDVDDKIDTLLVSKARQSEAILSGDPAAGAPVSIASMALSVLHDVFSTGDTKKKGKAA